MAANCRSCGAELPEGAGRCPACLAIVKPPGFFQKLFGGLKFNLSVNANPGRIAEPGFNVKTSVHRSQRFEIHDATTGKTKVYHSIEEVPEKYRELMNRAKAGEHVERNKQITIAGGHVNRSEQIVFVGPDGVRHTYKTMNEVPESVRKLIESAERPSDPK
jgi:hypothetical protein